MSSHQVPMRAVLAWTVPWLVAMGLLVLVAFWDAVPPVPYSIYVNIRLVAVLGLLVVVFAALKRTLSFVGKPEPWYTSGFLVAAVLFWALFPPIWFFVEYLLFDHGHIALSGGSSCKPDCPTVICASHLKRLESYAALASKIWAAVATVLAAAIAIAQGKARS